MFRIRDFQTSAFLIFTYGQIGKPRFQKSEIYKHPSFRYSPIVKYENLAYKKSEIFKHPPFRYSPIVKYENLAYKKSEIFKHQVLDIRL